MKRIGSLYRCMLLMLCCIGLPQPVLSDETRYNLQAVDDTILPGYQRLEKLTALLAQQSQAFCKQPSESGLQQLQADYHRAMDSWQFIQVVRFGPIEDSLRGYRLQFWPDKRQSVSRHLAKLLDKAEADALDPENFARGSVALQGFSALERLLFEKDLQAGQLRASAPKAYHCQVMVAISHNMAQIARELLDEWQTNKPAYRDLIASAPRGNAAYADSAEVSARLFNSLFTQIELMLDRKLRAPLGESLQRARGKRSESWRSGRSLRNLSHNLQSVHQLTRQAFMSRLVDPHLSQRIDERVANCNRLLNKIELPLAEAVKDAQQRQRVEFLVTALAGLKQTLLGELAPALEITIGFNSLDGD